MLYPDLYKAPQKPQKVLTTYGANKSKIETAYETWSYLSDQISAAE